MTEKPMHKILGTLTDEERVQFKRIATEMAALDATLGAAMRSHTESALRLRKCQDEIWDGVRARLPETCAEQTISVNHLTGEIFS
jgi:hypothetical protein